MSKPNLLSFSTSVGFYRNRKVRDARQLTAKAITRKVDFCELTPLLFSVVMAYASENQIDGDFSGYTDQSLREIFTNNNVDVSLSEAKIIFKNFESVGLMEDGKIRSWKKFNAHLANYEQNKKAKIKAGKIRQQQRAQELNGKPSTVSSEYGLGKHAENGAAEPLPPKCVRWNGKIFPVTAMQDAIKDIERQIAEKKKNKPDTGDASHNIWLSEINFLEKDLASARSALLGRPINPELTKAPKRRQVEPSPAPDLDAPEVQEGRARATNRLRALKEAVL